MAPQIVTERIGFRVLWPLAAASFVVLLAPAIAAPDDAAKPSAVVVAQADTAKPAPTEKAKDTASAKTKEKSKAKPATKEAAKPDAKTDKKAASEKATSEKAKSAKPKPETTKAQAKPDPKPDAKAEKEKKAAKKPDKSKAVAKPAVKPAAAAALAPPVAAALKPTLPKEDGPPSDPVPSAPSQTQPLPAPANTIITAAAIDVAAVKRAVEMVRNRKQSDAGEVKKNISDPVAKKLVEWVILRSDDSGADFARYTAFITANPNWPSIATLRRKAEAVAYQDQPPNAQIQAFFAQYPPLTAKGRFAQARALVAAGNRKEAEGVVRDAWRYDGFSQDVETRVFEAFGEFLTHADHKARMDRRLYEKDDTEAGLRAAARLGGNEILIAKARIAMLTKGGGKAALDAVPAAARNDIGYKFARIQMLRRADELAEAVALIKTIPQLDKSHDLDEWWMERRTLARKLLDDGNAK